MGKPVRNKPNSNSFGKGQQQRKGGGKQGAKGRDRDPAKWLHHSLKTIHKALKQAKNFEIRKITRRLAQARTEDAAAQGKAGPEVVEKLEQQLAAAKQAALDKLAQKAAAKAGLVVPGTAAAADEEPAGTAAAAATGGTPSELAAAVHQRLLAAACVQKQLAEQLTEFKRRFGQPADEQQSASKRHKTDPALNGDSIGSDVSGSEEGTASDAADGDDDDDDVDLEAEYERLQQLEQQQQQHVGPPADDELDEATLAALEKLKARCRAFESESDAEDSGVIMDTDDASLAHSEGDSADAELDSDDSQQQQQQQGNIKQKQQQQKAGKKEGQAAAAEQQEAAAAAGDGANSAAAAVVYPGPPPGNGPKQQQQQQQQMSKYEKLQAKKRAKLEKLLKRGKRIGQRMRRQLYEKLYGMDANHLKKVEQHSARRAARGYAKPQQESRNKDSSSQRPGTDKQQQRGPRSAAPKELRQAAGHGKQTRDDSKQHQEDLHPSWAARKKQQQQVIKIGAAAAKKVVFGDDGETVQQMQSVKQQQQQQRPPKSGNSGKPQHEPASQRTGGQRNSAAGSNKVGSSKPTAEQLHPSWQAKKQQQVVISAQPTGKKMVFDD